MRNLVCIVAILINVAPIPAHADDRANAFIGAINKAKSNYSECVLFAVAPLIKRDPQGDYALFTEQAFGSCRTEERFIRGMALAEGVPPFNVEQLMLNQQIAVKNLVREIAMNPNKYSGQR